ncbi:hypothetical protein [Caballeronia sp. J97]|uniref:hypothetical protein n=1 Tax=Caballeronia sp. J97 TaxID=2805429 RepID=UPI002AB310E0|nr:hypothetical protein [Caballeronia sp. J97]
MTIASLWTQIQALPTPVLTVVCAIAGAVGAMVAALITALGGKLLVTPFLSARDKQDREVEWRKHASELTKLDLERKLKSGRDFTVTSLRPSILDFLANYRDLQELGQRTPKDLYLDIVKNRLNSAVPTKAGQAEVKLDGDSKASSEKMQAAFKVGSWIAMLAVALTLIENRRRGK